MFIIFIPVYMFLVLPFRLVLSKETAGFVASCSQIQWGLMAFVFGLSHLAFLLVSVPARWLRFVLTTLVAAGVMRVLAPWTGRRAQIELALLGLAWAVVYAA